MNRVAFELQDIGPVFPTHYQSWVSMTQEDGGINYIFCAYYPDLRLEDFQEIYVPDTVYPSSEATMAIFEKRTLYVKAKGEIQTLFRLPQDANIDEISLHWSSDECLMTIKVPRISSNVSGERMYSIQTQSS